MVEAVSKSDAALARTGVLSRNADAIQREIDALSSGKRAKAAYSQFEPKKSRKVRKIDFIDRSNSRLR